MPIIKGKNSATTRYNFIAPYIKEGKILEIGANLNALLSSKSKEKILSSRYDYMDIVRPDPSLDENNKYHFIRGDITETPILDKYDTIIMLEVLEHIHYKDWVYVIKQLTGALKEDGILILSTPYKQKLNQYLGMERRLDDNQIHTVFGIDKKVMRHFFPRSKIRVLTVMRLHDKGGNVVRSIIRTFKRLVTLKINLLYSQNIFVFVRKEDTVINVFR